MKLFSEICGMILFMSAEVAPVILVVLLLRLFLRKLPKGFLLFLWLPVLLRLLCPVTLPAKFGLFPAAQIVAMQNSGNGAAAQADLAAKGQADEAKSPAAGGVSGQGAGKMPEVQGDGLSDRFLFARLWLERVWNAGRNIVTAVWASGCLLLSAVYIAQYAVWKKRLRCAVRTADGCYESGHVCSPFVCGFLHPRIYLPCGLTGKQREMIVLHEKMHIRHLDHLTRVLAQVSLVLHWFNPLVWASVYLLQKDMELYCDEAVIKRLGDSGRKDYSLALLAFSMRQSGLPVNIAFGESNTEKRIKHVLYFKKKGKAVLAAAVVIVGAAAVLLLTGPDNRAANTAMTEVDRMKAEEYDRLANKWAQAITDKAAEKVTSLLEDPASFWEVAEYTIGADADGSRFGWSSPWPWENDYVTNFDARTGRIRIHYYAMTSDPTVWVWTEDLIVIETDDGLRVRESEMQTSFIDSAAAFEAAYHWETDMAGKTDGIIQRGYRFEGTGVDYRTDRELLEEPITDILADRLKTMGADGRKEEFIQQFLTPETAAAAQLNLQGGTAVRDPRSDDENVYLRWQFEDGMTGVIHMAHPKLAADRKEQAEKLWIVTDLLEETEFAQAAQG